MTRTVCSRCGQPYDGTSGHGPGVCEPPAARYVTEASEPSPERFALYRLCPCLSCDGAGRDPDPIDGRTSMRCPQCRGEGRTRDLVATCATPEAVGVALVTLGREGEWNECPVGILDTQGEPGEKWIVRPWLPSARNVSDAGRTLARSKTREGT